MTPLFGFGRRGRDEPAGPTHLTATLPCGVCPTDRGWIFEDPLDAALAERGLGEVTGGGQMIFPDSGIIPFVDIDIEVKAADAPTLDLIVRTLEGCHAPRGSLLKAPGREVLRTFGRAEILRLTLDAATLPDAHYESFDVNVFIDRAVDLLRSGAPEAQRGAIAYHGHLSRDLWTDLFFCGPDYAALRAAIDPILTDPACENATVDRFVGRTEL